MGREIYEHKQIIAAFDFDGTITRSDTLPVFIKFVAKLPKFILGSIQMIPYLIMFKLKIIPNHSAKEKLFKIFFKGFEVRKFNQIAKNFSTKIDGLVNPMALEKIKWHQDMGHHIVIISASAENWVIPWANQHGINEVLATKLQVIDKKLTGNFLTKNCYGQEKVNRLLEMYPNRNDYTLYAYGDTNGDKQLLAVADYSFFKCYN